MPDDTVQKLDSEGFIKKNWKIGLIVLGLVGWLLSGFFAYSLKKTTDELKLFKSTHSETETVHEPVLVGGKIVYRDRIVTVHDTVDASNHKKTETIWKSGLSLGVLYDLQSKQLGGYGVADVIPLGPGTTQVNVTAFNSGVFVGGGYRILF